MFTRRLLPIRLDLTSDERPDLGAVSVIRDSVSMGAAQECSAVCCNERE